MPQIESTPLTDSQQNERELLKTAQDGSLNHRTVSVLWHPEQQGVDVLNVAADLQTIRALPGIEVWKDHVITLRREQFRGDKVNQAQVTALARVLFAQLIDTSIHHSNPHHFWVRIRDISKELPGSHVLHMQEEFDKLFDEYERAVLSLDQIHNGPHKPHINFGEMKETAHEELERIRRKKCNANVKEFHQEITDWIGWHVFTNFRNAKAPLHAGLARTFFEELREKLSGKHPKLCDVAHEAITDFLELNKTELKEMVWEAEEEVRSLYDYIQQGVLAWIKGVVISRAICQHFVSTKRNRVLSGAQTAMDRLFHRTTSPEDQMAVDLYRAKNRTQQFLFRQRDVLDREAYMEAKLQVNLARCELNRRMAEMDQRIYDEWQCGDKPFMDLLGMRMRFAAHSTQRHIFKREQSTHSRFTSRGKEERARLQKIIDRIDERIEEDRQNILAFLDRLTPVREKEILQEGEVAEPGGNGVKELDVTFESIRYYESMLSEMQDLEKKLPRRYRKVFCDSAITKGFAKALAALRYRCQRYRTLAAFRELNADRLLECRQTCLLGKKKGEEKEQKRIKQDYFYRPAISDRWEFSADRLDIELEAEEAVRDGETGS